MSAPVNGDETSEERLARIDRWLTAGARPADPDSEATA